MSLSERRLRRDLRRELRFYARVGSTNDIAKTWLQEGAGEGALVIADEQRRGRGRLGREWHTPPGVALALSLILKPEPADVALVNMLGALSVCDLADELGCPDISLKWPNDVLIMDKKVSGILTENVWRGGRLLGVVLGIGFNVRADFRGTHLAGRAISLEDLVEQRLDRTALLRALLGRVDHWRGQSGKQIFLTWKRRLSALGSQVTVDGACGIALDVRRDGALLVQLTSGEIKPLLAGDVSVAGPGSRA